MTEKAANQKSSEHTPQDVEPAPSAGPEGMAFAPPAYGIDFLDQAPVGAGSKGDLVLQRKADVATPALNAVPPLVHEVLRSPGQPLDVETRAFMEPRFGRDLSGVRVHTGEKAAESARAVSAHAYTVGRDIVFGAGQPAPRSNAGLQLTAHELTHVVQQENTPGLPGSLAVQRDWLDPSSRLEQQAETIARAVTQGPPPSKTGRPPLAPGAPELGVGAVQREPDPALPAKQPAVSAGVPALFALSGGDDTQNMLDVMSAVEAVRPAESGGGFITEFRGKSISLTLAQRDQLRTSARMAITRSLGRARRDSDEAKNGYEIQKQINEDQWFVSGIVVTFAGVRSKVPKLLAAVAAAESSATAVEGGLKSNNFVQAGQQLVECERAARQAKTLWHEYHEGIVSTGEATVTVLEYTRDASFITLGVLAVIATGGAAAAGAGAVTTTTAFGVQVGTVAAANVIATGAPILATLGGAGMKTALGEKVDWLKVGIDVAVNLVLSRFGGKISNTIFTRMLGNSSVRSLGAIAFGRIFSSLVTHELSTAFSTAVDDTYKKLTGQNVTWEQFSDELVDRLLDPKGLIVAGLMGAVVAGADAKLGGSRGVEIVDKNKSPIGEIDEIRAGAIREKKSAEGLGTINPKTGKPYPGSDEATWAKKQIFSKTKVRIENISGKNAADTRPSAKMTEDPMQAAGSSAYPNLKELQGVRKYNFQIDADTPSLRAEVTNQIANLQKIFPDWDFSAVFGR